MKKTFLFSKENKKLIEDMEPLFKELETLQNDIKIAEETYNKLIKELADEAMPNQPITPNVNNTTTFENNDEVEEIKQRKVA